jgi:hypothetical protein
MFDYKVIANKLRKFLMDSLGSESYSVKIEDPWKTSTLTYYIDAVIYKDDSPLAVMEVKSGLKNVVHSEQSIVQLRSYMELTKARYGILTDGEAYYILDDVSEMTNLYPVSFNDLTQLLTHPQEYTSSESIKSRIVDCLRKVAAEMFTNNSKLIGFIENEIDKDRIGFDSQTNAYYLQDRSGNERHGNENKLFNLVFSEKPRSKICRYTSLGTLFSMLNKHSFRMCGLAGMNDKSEVNYVDRYLNGTETPYGKLHHNTISAINKRYITSCCNIRKKDDLTLWRLYGDNSRGVCLIFDTIGTNLGNRVLLHEVKYPNKEGKHEELDFVKEVISRVKTLYGAKFEFRKLMYWKHFFKPIEFQVESEVRLLIVDDGSLTKERKQDWVITNDHSIIIPVVDFNLNDHEFPLVLREIILGPNCPEREINLKQIQELLRMAFSSEFLVHNSRKKPFIKVSESSIKNYR